MHGTMAMPTTTNRKGRKRKSGRRTTSGRIIRAPVDYRAMAALQPRRIGLPVALRGHERAESVLGCLALLNRISEAQYESGRRYAVLVGAYLAMAGAPRSTAGNGHGGHECPTGTCDTCRNTMDRYMRAHEAIGRHCQGIPRICRHTHAAVNWVVIDDHLCTAEQLEYLKLGLTALAQHFGLTNRRNS
jgi:hypothetical protein